MSDENVTSTEATATEADAPSVAAAGVGAGPEGGPVPGDPSSEPVATGAQSHVIGRVGPPSIQQDETAAWHTGEGVTTVAPGTVLDSATPIENGPVAFAVPDPSTFGAGPYGSDTPAEESPATVHATKPGDSEPTAEELPAGTVQHAAAKAKAGDSATSGGSATSPTSPGDSPASSDSGSAGDADSGSAGTSDSAEPTASKSTTRKR
jgi:hypothetical protein